MTEMARPRLLFVDNLRTLMIVLVIVAHLSISYGGEGGWYYEGQADTLSSVLLTWFNAACQSFFMGLLFLLSAYFTVGACERKGPGKFARDRLLRLGVPMLAFDWIGHPLTIYILARARILLQDISFRRWLGDYVTSFHIGRGPLWFVEALLFFSFFYLLWQRVKPSRPKAGPKRHVVPGDKEIIALAFLLAIVSFLVRLWIPLGANFEPLNFQFCFFPQYITLFILGTHAYRHGWLTSFPVRTGRRWLIIGAALILVGFPLLFLTGGGLSGDLEPFTGGLHWQALALAMWEQFTGLAMMAGLLVLFRERFNRQNRLTAEAAASSYTAYIIHTPVIVLYVLAVHGIQLYPLLKFAMAVLIAVPLCFVLAAGIRRLPGAARIL